MAANAAAAIARLGGEAVFWGPIGEDAVADAIRARLIADGMASMCGGCAVSKDAHLRIPQ